MCQVTSLLRCARLLVYYDVPGYYFTTMCQATSLLRCVRLLLYYDVSGYYFTTMCQVTSLLRCARLLVREKTLISAWSSLLNTQMAVFDRVNPVMSLSVKQCAVYVYCSVNYDESLFIVYF